MSKPIIRIHDLATNEIIDREMTVAEFEEYTNPKVEIPERIQQMENLTEIANFEQSGTL